MLFAIVLVIMPLLRAQFVGWLKSLILLYFVEVLAEGLPAYLCKNVIKAPLVHTLFGEKVVLVVPFTIPLLVPQRTGL